MTEQTLSWRRRLGAALILALVITAVAGIWRMAGTTGRAPAMPAGGGATPAPAPGDGPQPPQLVLGSLGGFEGWNPLLTERHPLQPLLFRSLVRYNDRMEVEPDLAASWEVGKDGRVYTLHLAEATWWDGRPVTASDVVFSLTTRLHPRADRLAAYNLAALNGAETYLAELDRLDRDRQAGLLDEATWEARAMAAYDRWLERGAVRAPDPRTVVVTFSEPYAPALELFTLPVVPAHAFASRAEALDPRHPFHTGHPVGSGPYRLDSWVPGVQARLVAREDLPPEQAPGYPLVVVRFFHEQEELDRAVLAGEVDAGRLSPEAARQVVAGQAPLRLVEFPDLGYTYLAYNLADPILADPAVRRAVEQAVDRSALVGALFGRYAEVLAGPGLPGTWWAAPQAPPRYDPEAARALLEQAGWVDGDGDGVRERGEQQLAIRIITHRENRYREEAAEMLAGFLRQVGIAAEVQVVDWPDLVAVLREGRYQAALLGVGVGVDPDGYALWHSAGHLNFTGLHDAEVDRLLEEGRRGGDRRVIYRQVQQRLAELEPALFLWQEILVLGVRQGVEGPISGSPGGFFWNVAAWHPADEPGPTGGPAAARGGTSKARRQPAHAGGAPGVHGAASR
ncbi:ABC transporter substrate-binding protein [Thermaerobacter subterraneus]|uniref:ABC-type dipeptide transport system, periplasmic component n=1 Tax=Thermaerobacter subterraneus DSM 13965 TaxID=867903 RepID=K6Q0D3_9FIRM|nr:ABC transporter substrate-binding protein [Thermaerobacter subterraneus]EKP94523.1 ABC-type dipeptide transport system, periplasmic component [Thermaerobacter subterraneus DSM 13965]